ncbi:geranylgeranylglyceryl/heptaprenylglyceryl phosphate synthase [Candidatus Micrarchaeota archaeon]|nr:geranylgeranylglyceryl/heptaprenylglyceryl phosphate synthase [Candidatus Micrarchaeota archaeon]
MPLIGKTYQKILQDLESQKALAFLVIDPPNQTPEVTGKVCKVAQEVGFNAIAIGGSVGAQGELLDQTILQAKENCSLPVVLFPGNIASVSKHADAIYFMSLLNSLDPYYISGAQIASAMPIKKIGLETIPTSYIVVDPGRAVGWVGRAQLIPRNIPYLAAATALAGQKMGSQLIILESGGGAPSPAPPEMISIVKKTIDVPLLVAGGVGTEQFAFETMKAGADIIHVGAAIERSNCDLSKARKAMEGIVKGMKKGVQARK